jgi:hypothetical protein
MGPEYRCISLIIPDIINILSFSRRRAEPQGDMCSEMKTSEFFCSEVPSYFVLLLRLADFDPIHFDQDGQHIE